MAAAKAAKRFETFAARKQNGAFCEYESVLVMDAATARAALGMALSAELDRRKTMYWQVGSCCTGREHNSKAQWPAPAAVAAGMSALPTDRFAGAGAGPTVACPAAGSMLVNRAAAQERDTQVACAVSGI